MAICNIIKELRENKKISMAKIAEALEIPKGTYASYEYGQREPNIEMINKIADFYGVTTDYLFGRESLPDPFAGLSLANEDEKDMLAKYMSLPEHMRAILLDALRQLGGVMNNVNNEESVLERTVDTEKLKDEFEPEQDEKRGKGKSA